jgi:hypothetical protein
MTPDLAALIERLEKANGPSRILDAQIEVEHRRLHALAIGLTEEARAKWYVVGTKGEVEDGPHCRYHAPEYTGSIDVALTLYPNKPFVLALTGQWAEHMPNAKQPIYEAAFPDDTADFEETYIGDLRFLQPASGQGATPAIALCVAALRARAAITKGG